MLPIKDNIPAPSKSHWTVRIPFSLSDILNNAKHIYNNGVLEMIMCSSSLRLLVLKAN